MHFATRIAMIVAVSSLVLPFAIYWGGPFWLPAFLQEIANSSPVIWTLIVILISITTVACLILDQKNNSPGLLLSLYVIALSLTVTLLIPAARGFKSTYDHAIAQSEHLQRENEQLKEELQRKQPARLSDAESPVDKPPTFTFLTLHTSVKVPSTSWIRNQEVLTPDVRVPVLKYDHDPPTVYCASHIDSHVAAMSNLTWGWQRVLDFTVIAQLPNNESAPAVKMAQDERFRDLIFFKVNFKTDVKLIGVTPSTNVLPKETRLQILSPQIGGDLVKHDCHTTDVKYPEIFLSEFHSSNAAQLSPIVLGEKSRGWIGVLLTQKKGYTGIDAKYLVDALPKMEWRDVGPVAIVDFGRKYDPSFAPQPHPQ